VHGREKVEGFAWKVDPALHLGSVKLWLSLGPVGETKLDGAGNECTDQRVEIVVLEADLLELVVRVFEGELGTETIEECASLVRSGAPLIALAGRESPGRLVGPAA
jgi:hypothetical protein